MINKLILSNKLLNQAFANEQDEEFILQKQKFIAEIYAQQENSIAVLSDLKQNRSYIFNGGVAKSLDIAKKHSTSDIDTIWEDEIFEHIHPEDLSKKHVLEFKFFHLLKGLPIKERSDYYISSEIRMRDASGVYYAITHRMFYVQSCSKGSLWLALCLYNFSKETSFEVNTEYGMIYNSAMGTIIDVDNSKFDNILSKREKEILQLIEKGKISKEIADSLSISKNTVSRHRQNILEKLRVKNSLEACRIAKELQIL